MSTNTIAILKSAIHNGNCRILSSHEDVNVYDVKIVFWTITEVDPYRGTVVYHREFFKLAEAEGAF